MNRYVQNLALIVVLLAFAENAFANVLGLFPIGADAKSAAMDSAVESRDVQSLLYNPANLSFSDVGLQGEMGVGRLSYGYEHPRFDPVTVSLFSPVASAGWRIRQDGPFALGFAVAPTSNADLKINGLPRRVSGKVESLDVNTTRRQLHVPVGISWSAGNSLSVGASLVATYDHRTLRADSLVDGTRLVDMTARGVFFRPVIGSTLSCSSADLSLAYTAATAKHYKGTSTVAPEAAAFDTEQVDYDPAILATGVRILHSDLSVSLSVNRLFAARGKDTIRDGINRRSTRADVHDVNHIGSKIGYLLSPEQDVSLAYAYLPTTWGAGDYSVDADGFAYNELGHLFGNFNAMPVRNQAASWNYKSGDLKWRTSLFRSAGRHSIAGGGDNPGHYQIEFISLSTGLSTAF